MHPSLELRDEAIAAFALADVAEEGSWQAARIYTPDTPAFAPDLDRYALGKTSGEVLVYRMATGEKIGNLQAPAEFGRRVAFQPERTTPGSSLRQRRSDGVELDERCSRLRLEFRQTPPSAMSFDFSPDSGTVAISMEEMAFGFSIWQATWSRRRCIRRRFDWPELSTGRPGNSCERGVEHRDLESDRTTRDTNTSATPKHWLPFLASRRSPARIVVRAEPGCVALGYEDDQQLAVERAFWNWSVTSAFSHRGDVLMSAAADGSTRFWDAGSGELLFRLACGIRLAIQRR